MSRGCMVDLDSMESRDENGDENDEKPLVVIEPFVAVHKATSE